MEIDMDWITVDFWHGLTSSNHCAIQLTLKIAEGV